MLQVFVLSVQQHSGNADCVIFPISFALAACSTLVNKSEIKLDNRMLRSHLFIKCLCRMEFTAFPKRPMKEEKTPLLRTRFTFPALARLPESYGDMVECN